MSPVVSHTHTLSQISVGRSSRRPDRSSLSRVFIGYRAELRASTAAAAAAANRYAHFGPPAVPGSWVSRHPIHDLRDCHPKNILHDDGFGWALKHGGWGTITASRLLNNRSRGVYIIIGRVPKPHHSHRRRRIRIVPVVSRKRTPSRYRKSTVTAWSHQILPSYSILSERSINGRRPSIPESSSSEARGIPSGSLCYSVRRPDVHRTIAGGAMNVSTDQEYFWIQPSLLG